jgi:hypothetical protein
MTKPHDTAGGGGSDVGGGEDETVGYMKPPKATRWQKGQSGNPKGRRPKEKVENLTVLFDEILMEEIPVTINGRSQKMSKLHAIIEQVRNKALQGEPKAVRALLQLSKSAGILSKSAAPKFIVITPTVPEDSDLGRIIQMMPKPAETKEPSET